MQKHSTPQPETSMKWERHNNNCSFVRYTASFGTFPNQIGIKLDHFWIEDRWELSTHGWINGRFAPTVIPGNEGGALEAAKHWAVQTVLLVVQERLHIFSDIERDLTKNDIGIQ